MKETLNLIAHATHNEFDTLILGKAGDQIGCELQARAWFSYPWDYIYRAKNIEDREKIANLVEKAVLNGFIGYDTNRNNRDTLFKNIYKNFPPVDINKGSEELEDMDPIYINITPVEEINTHCYTDCSSLGYCAIYQITGVPFRPTLDMKKESLVNICPKVIHYADYMQLDKVAALFDKLEGDEYISSSKNLLRGDILVALGHHIAIWI